MGVHRIGMVARSISEIAQARYFGQKILFVTIWIVPIYFAFAKIWKYVCPFVQIKNASELLQSEDKGIKQIYPTKVPTLPTLFHSLLPMLIVFKIRIRLNPPTWRFCPFRGNRCSSFGGLMGAQATLYKYTILKNPKPTFSSQLRWDPLSNACMMVRVEIKATVFRYLAPSSPTIPPIYKFLELYKSRR